MGFHSSASIEASTFDGGSTNDFLAYYTTSLGVTSNKQILFGLSSRIVFCLISMVLLLKERTMVVLLVYKHLSFRMIRLCPTDLITLLSSFSVIPFDSELFLPFIL